MDLSFSNVSDAQWQAICAALAAKGLPLTGTQGTVEKFGAKVTYGFGSGNLAIAVLSAPHFHSLANFTAEIKTFIEQAIA